MASQANSPEIRLLKQLQNVVSALEAPAVSTVIIHDVMADRPALALLQTREAAVTYWQPPWQTLKSTKHISAHDLNPVLDERSPGQRPQAYFDLGTTDDLMTKVKRAEQVKRVLRDNAFGIVGLRESYSRSKPDIVSLRETYQGLGCEAYLLSQLNTPRPNDTENRYLLFVKPETIIKGSRINRPASP